jgi:hypothetical protein
VAEGLKKRQRYRWRFAFVYVALVAAGGVVAGATIAVLNRPPPPKPVPWTNWAPPEGIVSLDAVRAIANHAENIYRWKGTRIAAVVRGGPMVERDLALPLARRESQDSTDVAWIEGRTVRFDVCGTSDGAKSCAISKKVPADVAGVLSRRMAYELTLLTFKYVEDVDNVVVVMPPVDPTKPAPRALVAERSEVNAQLREKHLSLPGSPTTITAPAAIRIAETTDRYLYRWLLSPVEVSGADGQTETLDALIIDPIARIEKNPVPKELEGKLASDAS